MSSIALSWARTQHPRNASGKLDPEAKLVLMVLADMDNQKDETHTVWPSHRLLRERTSLAISTIGKRLKLLEDGGYITRKYHRHEQGPRKGQRASDRISINVSKAPDPDVESGEQPEALKKANMDRKNRSVATGKRSPGESVRERREAWERELGDEWKQSGQWWDTPADIDQELVVIDPSTDTVIEKRGTWTQVDRPASRRRPVEMWTKKDVLEEILCYIRRVNPDGGEVEAVVTRHFEVSVDRPVFRPVPEIAAVRALCADPDFLMKVSRDEVQAGWAILDRLQQTYQRSRSTLSANWDFDAEFGYDGVDTGVRDIV